VEPLRESVRAWLKALEAKELSPQLPFPPIR
jgi:hypothetical protein